MKRVTWSKASLFGLLILVCVVVANGANANAATAVPPGVDFSTVSGALLKESMLKQHANRRDDTTSRIKQAKTKSEGLLRMLQSTLSPPANVAPTRSCGDIITIATVEQIQQVASFVVSALLGSGTTADFALVTLQDMVLYNVQAQVVCGSCDSIRDMVMANNSTGGSFNGGGGGGGGAVSYDFESYCGTDKFASNVTYSSLLLLPMDPSTNVVASGNTKTHFFMKSFSGRDQHAPTEFWPDDFDIFATTDAAVIQNVYADFYDGWAPLFIASSGVVVMSLDYLGYGQSYLSPKLPSVIAMYQQAAAVAYWSSKSTIESSTPCVVLQSQTSLSGYSEGGFAAVVAASTVRAFGLRILNVDAGGTPFRQTFQWAYAIAGMDDGTLAQGVQELSVSFAAAYSSKTPDLANSNVGQNFLNDEYVTLLNAVTDGNLEFLALGPYLPNATTDVLNTAFLENTRAAISAGGINACSTTTAGEDNLLCQALILNQISVQGTTFPISICHSFQDTYVPRSGHAPDFSLSNNLYELQLFGIGATGDHFEAAEFCKMASVVQFTSFGSAPRAPLSGIESFSCTTISPAAVAPAAPLMPTLFEDDEIQVSYTVAFPDGVTGNYRYLNNAMDVLAPQIALEQFPNSAIPPVNVRLPTGLAGTLATSCPIGVSDARACSLILHSVDLYIRSGDPITTNLMYQDALFAAVWNGRLQSTLESVAPNITAYILPQPGPTAPTGGVAPSFGTPTAPDVGGSSSPVVAPTTIAPVVMTQPAVSPSPTFVSPILGTPVASLAPATVAPISAVPVTSGPPGTVAPVSSAVPVTSGPPGTVAPVSSAVPVTSGPPETVAPVSSAVPGTIAPVGLNDTTSAPSASPIETGTDAPASSGIAQFVGGGILSILSCIALILMMA